VKLAWIWLVNDRDEEYKLEVAVEDNGKRIFAETLQLGPRTAESGNKLIESPVDGRGHYVVRVTTEAESREVDVTELVSGDKECVGVRFSLLSNGTMDWWHRSMNQC
jgi:hypothetical protein